MMILAILFISLALSNHTLVELPLLIRQRVRSKVAFVYCNDQSIFVHELCKQSANPQSFVIECRISILQVCCMHLSKLEMKVFFEDLKNGFIAWHYQLFESLVALLDFHQVLLDLKTGEVIYASNLYKLLDLIQQHWFIPDSLSTSLDRFAFLTTLRLVFLPKLLNGLIHELYWHSELLTYVLGFHLHLHIAFNHFHFLGCKLTISTSQEWVDSFTLWLLCLRNTLSLKLNQLVLNSNLTLWIKSLK